MAEIKNWLILWTYSSEVQNMYLGAPLCRDVWLSQYQPDLMKDDAHCTQICATGCLVLPLPRSPTFPADKLYTLG